MTDAATTPGAAEPTAASGPLGELPADLFADLDRGGPVPLWYQISVRLESPSSAVSCRPAHASRTRSVWASAWGSRARRSGAPSRSSSTRGWSCGAAASAPRSCTDR